jgi:hypothetical protein
VVSFTARPLYILGKKTRYTLARKLGRPQTWSGSGDEGKIALAENRVPVIQFVD